MIRVRLARPTACCLALVLFASPLLATDWPEVRGDSFTFTEVREGIWHVEGTGAIAVGANGVVIEGEADLLLVDSHITAAAARALLADLPRISDKPIRYVVNTHFHFDHTHGNQVFGPQVEIVAHEFTRAKVAAGDTKRGRGYDYFIAALPERIATLETELENASPERRTELEATIDRTRRLWEQDRETTPVPPTLALRQAVTLYRGGREIRILYFGRGHTGGDVVVYLPAEKLLATGDLLRDGLPYMGDGFPLEWADTLEHLKSLDFDTVLPGHGRAYEETDSLERLQAYLRDLWRQAVELHRQGVPAAEAAARIDLTAHARHFAQIDGPGAPLHAVDRIWELLAEDPAAPR